MKTKRARVSCAAVMLAAWMCACSEEGAVNSGNILSAPDAIVVTAKHSICVGVEGFHLASKLPFLGLVYDGEFREVLADVFQCVVDADDCDEVYECIGFLPDEKCDPEKATSRCISETELVECQRVADGTGRAQVVRCDFGPPGHVPGYCIADEDGGDAHCGTGTCDPVKVPEYWCEGQVLVRCDDRVTVAQDCAAMGRKCIEGEDGYAGCGTGAPCKHGSRCEGDTLVLCSQLLGVEMNRIDCGELGGAYSCVEKLDDDGTIVGCDIPLDDQECERDTSYCSGTVAQVCAAGVMEEFDCASFENAWCEAIPSNDPDDQQALAHATCTAH